MRKPDFEQFLKVVHREAPDRPTLYEFYMNDAVYRALGAESPEVNTMLLKAFATAGYDYSTVLSGGFFSHRQAESAASYSLNATATITSREEFDAYPWPQVDRCFDFGWFKRVRPEIPAGMKLIPAGPCGVLENLICLMGYENLCLTLLDDPELVKDVADRIGEILLEYYGRVLEFPEVGACMVNDDWGFNSQPMLDPDSMRRLVVPWHRKIVAEIHRAGRPALLHSCGNLELLMDDIVDDIGFDAKHSFEDKIQPVEEAYEAHHRRIALLGGLDVDFLCRATPDEVRKRALAMLERTAGRGGYALGSGNSIPPYVPTENYFAMIGAAGV